MKTKKALKIYFFTGSQSLRGGTERACSDVCNLLVGLVPSISILSQFSGLNSGYPVSDLLGEDLDPVSISYIRGFTWFCTVEVSLLVPVGLCRT